MILPTVAEIQDQELRHKRVRDSQHSVRVCARGQVVGKRMLRQPLSSPYSWIPVRSLGISPYSTLGITNLARSILIQQLANVLYGFTK